MRDRVGQRLGQYELIARIGEGGMASVYRARQASIHREVAIKVIETTLTRSPEFIQRFEREAQTIAALSHPHIVKVFDYGQQQDAVYLVMELLTGGSLADVLRGGPLPPRIANRILSQIAPALTHAHKRGVIHRDLKPHNVLMDSEVNAYLTDFGIAKLLNDPSALTRLGVAMGTPTYMSPEQWRREALDARADIYALGVMLFQILTGRLPFVAKSTMQLMQMHLSEAPPPLHSLNPDLPAALQPVIDRAMAKDRDERFASASELAAAFKAALVGRPLAEMDSLLTLSDYPRAAGPVAPGSTPATPPDEAEEAGGTLTNPVSSAMEELPGADAALSRSATNPIPANPLALLEDEPEPPTFATLLRRPVMQLAGRPVNALMIGLAALALCAALAVLLLLIG